MIYFTLKLHTFQCIFYFYMYFNLYRTLLYIVCNSLYFPYVYFISLLLFIFPCFRLTSFFFPFCFLNFRPATDQFSLFLIENISKFSSSLKGFFFFLLCIWCSRQAVIFSFSSLMTLHHFLLPLLLYLSTKSSVLLFFL